MQQEHIDLLDDQVFEKLELDFGIEKKQLKALGQSEAFVYSYPKDQPSDIYRLTHNSHRSIIDMEAEALFILHLKKYGIQTMSSKFLKDQSLASEIACDNGSFILSRYSFEKGREVELGSSKEMDLELAKKWGILFANLHKASISLSDDIDRATIFDREWVYADKFIQDQAILQKSSEALTWMKSLEQTRESFGLIHGDLHTGNLLLDEQDEMIMLDFDDCLYHFFVDDLAVVLHSYRYVHKLDDDWDIFGDEFTKTLLSAYQSVREVPSDYFNL
ncbi:phosphotransferase [bacterium]|nr:phosphotransferase [bacterium]